MWSTLAVILRGKAARSEAALIDRNAVVILEQRIREATAATDAAKRSLATQLVKIKADERTLEILSGRIKDLEDRTRAAIAAGREGLARDGAKLLAELENERIHREEVLLSSDERSQRLRLAIEKIQRRLIDLRQGLFAARSIEAERRTVGGDVSAATAIREGEAVLERITQGIDPLEELEAYEALEADFTGETVVERLAEAGFGEPLRVTAEQVLQRLSTPQSDQQPHDGNSSK